MHRICRALVWTAAIALACLLALPGAAAAQELPPRPEPTSEPSPAPQPTVAPAPQDAADDDDGGRRQPAPSGRLTGTVIDLTTGAPAAGIVVTLGDWVVATDLNGNYDRAGLPAGSYAVALALAPGQGEPAQAPAVVALADGATVVQHLAFRGPTEPASGAGALGLLGLLCAGLGGRAVTGAFRQEG